MVVTVVLGWSLRYYIQYIIIINWTFIVSNQNVIKTANLWIVHCVTWQSGHDKSRSRGMSACCVGVVSSGSGRSGGGNGSGGIGGDSSCCRGWRRRGRWEQRRKSWPDRGSHSFRITNSLMPCYLALLLLYLQPLLVYLYLEAPATWNILYLLGL